MCFSLKKTAILVHTDDDDAIWVVVHCVAKVRVWSHAGVWRAGGIVQGAIAI